MSPSFSMIMLSCQLVRNPGCCQKVAAIKGWMRRELCYLHYSCDDGRCIDIVNRCDGVAHCDDLSDEKSCQLVNIDPKKYLKGKTPPSETETLPVEVSSQVWLILGIQEVGQLTKIQFELSLKWYDSRLQYYNLKDNEKMNSLLFEEKQRLLMLMVF